MDDHFLEVIRAPFAARLTGSTLSSGTYLYSWTEQAFNPSTGAYQDATPPRSGTATIAPAVEANNANVTTPVYVWLKLRGMVGGTPYYEFVAPGTSSGGSSSLSWAIISQQVTIPNDSPTLLDWTSISSNNSAILSVSGANLQVATSGSYMIWFVCTQATSLPAISGAFGGWFGFKGTPSNYFDFGTPAASLTGWEGSFTVGPYASQVNAPQNLLIYVYQKTGAGLSMATSVYAVKIA